jgi:hypothetical protein
MGCVVPALERWRENTVAVRGSPPGQGGCLMAARRAAGPACPAGH